MADSRLTTIGDALITLLNGQSWETSITFTRRWGVFTQLTDATPVGTLIPRTIEQNPDSQAREGAARQYGYQLVIQQKLESYDANKPPANASVDPLVRLAEEIWEYLEPNDSGDAPEPSDARYVSTIHEDAEVINTEDLQERRLVTLLLMFVYEDYR